MLNNGDNSMDEKSEIANFYMFAEIVSAIEVLLPH